MLFKMIEIDNKTPVDIKTDENAKQVRPTNKDSFFPKGKSEP